MTTWLYPLGLVALTLFGLQTPATDKPQLLPKSGQFVADTTNRPDENRFTKTVLFNDLNEPMELAVAPDGRVFFVERAGKFYMYDPTTRKTRLLHDFPVKAVEKYLNGLLGITIDPDFARHPYLYFFYTTQDGDKTKQRIARFTVANDNTLDLASEKVVIEFPIDLEVSAHTGGSMAWDAHRNLFISTGDNTVPFESQGFAPIDAQPGRLVYDAQRSAGNPNDLRGKILRITVDLDGNYTVPNGNLFAKGTSGTRPEIFVMGCRNPYRISVDTATSTVYWGEIGPDSGVDGPQGPRGYDEFNQAKQAGNYGWPYFVGDSKPYHHYDFATKTVDALFDPAAPVNESPNNTGAKTLPPVHKPMVWYPYGKSDEFPQLGVGGRCAMGGPTYHYSAALKSTTKLPVYYDKALFMYDWMRNWVMAVRLDENQNYQSMEAFMPKTGDFRRPVDMEIGPEGSIYMLEYGSVYGIDNDDARLVRLDFNPGNRAPVAKITAKDTIGLAPLTVAFGNGSYDYDKADQLAYSWQFEGEKTPTVAATPTHTFRKNGIYKVRLTATDGAGRKDVDTLTIRVGNTLPQVAISTTDNKTFFFPNQKTLVYNVMVKDNEDKLIDKKRVNVALNYIPKVADNSPQLGHQQLSATYNLGKSLIAGSDCKACHQVAAKSVGPAFTEISKKYRDDKTATAKLANKIITGGGGVWGEHAMSAHPQLSRDETTEMVKYIMSLGNEPTASKLPQAGTVDLAAHQGTDQNGRYILTASYTDRGGAITPMTTSETLLLRPTRFAAAEATDLHNIERQGKRLGSAHDGSSFALKGVDLTGITDVTYRYGAKDHGATLEIRTGSPTGPVISTTPYTATGDWRTFANVRATIQPTTGKQDLYFIFRKPDDPKANLVSLESVTFEK
ncbi:PQQ-dependent sugar dehydrogenase [Fibrella aquatilis]|uniref:PQQ-dependent sugar dehydrogenase n=1 Tax=Fibrella aquatilis TaxID=2817059 RepID=A0A939GBB8_9BACT|nr:PQQ-dependent sugar dehydrogenase [Fibrella aquatilis]MBO0933497.1 PQQ-dependent sugar dehydrogenase [Fibrella aquatilis]